MLDHQLALGAAEVHALLCPPGDRPAVGAAPTGAAAGEVARNLTRLRCWPSDAFGALYDEMARRGHLHELLLRSGQPVELLEHVLTCGGGGAQTRLAALVYAVAGRPAEDGVLGLCVELERRTHGQLHCCRPRAGQCPAERLRSLDLRCRPAADFARKLDARLRLDACYSELPVATLVEALEARVLGEAGHVRPLVLDELCRRCCSGPAARLDGISDTTAAELLCHGCPDALSDAHGPGALSPSAVAVLHAVLCRAHDGGDGGGGGGGGSTGRSAELSGHAGGRLLQRFVHGVAAGARASSADGGTAGTFRYAASIGQLLCEPEGRRALSRNLAKHRGGRPAIAAHDRGSAVSFTWLQAGGTTYSAAAADRSTEFPTAARLAHFWLFLVSHTDRVESCGSQWCAALGDHDHDHDHGGTGLATASGLRESLDTVLSCLCWGSDKRGQMPKRRKKGTASEEDDYSVVQRIDHNLPLLACLHSLADAISANIDSLPDLHRTALQLCQLLLEAFDGIAAEVARPAPVPTLEGQLPPSETYVNCGAVILQLVYSICTYLDGCDEDCMSLVFKHHSEMILTRCIRFDGTPPMRLFAVTAGQIARSMHTEDVQTTSFDPDSTARDAQARTELHWRLFGEIVLQVRLWSAAHEEHDYLKEEDAHALLVLPAEGLMQSIDTEGGQSQSALGVATREQEVTSACYCGVIAELLNLVKTSEYTVAAGTDTYASDIGVAALETLFHLVSKPYERELTLLWRQEAVDAVSETSSEIAALQVLTTCTQVLQTQRQNKNTNRGRRCCAVAVRVMLGLFRASAVSSSERVQQLCSQAILNDGEPSPHAFVVLSSLVECGFGFWAGGVSLALTAECTQCLQYIAGAHDSLAAAILADETSFPDMLLSWSAAALLNVSDVSANARASLYSVVASISGLLALCVERAAAHFWAQFGEDVRFFALLSSLLDVVLDERGGTAAADGGSKAHAQATRHTLRFVGNVADAMTFTSRLNQAEVPQRLQGLAQAGARVGLSSEGCARVGQMLRSIAIYTL